MIKLNNEELKIINYASGEFGIKTPKFIDNDNDDFERKFIIEWIVEDLYKEFTQIIILKQYLNNLINSLYIVDQDDQSTKCDHWITLKVDFLPFAREDKDNSDKLNIYRLLYDKNSFLHKDYLMNIETIDNHSLIEFYNDTNCHHKTKIIKSNREKFIIESLNKAAYNFELDNLIIVFPDESSKIRYFDFLKEETEKGSTCCEGIIEKNIFYYINFSKKRNEKGEIIEQYIKNHNLPSNGIEKIHIYNLIMVDDICSYGNTFINAIKIAKSFLDEHGIKYEKTLLFTTYNEEQAIEKKLQKEFDEVVFMKSINFRGNK